MAEGNLVVCGLPFVPSKQPDTWTFKKVTLTRTRDGRCDEWRCTYENFCGRAETAERAVINLADGIEAVVVATRTAMGEALAAAKAAMNRRETLQEYLLELGADVGFVVYMAQGTEKAAKEKRHD